MNKVLIADNVADAGINISDVGKALDIAVSLITNPTNDQKVAMDINGDGNLNISDVGLLLDMAVGLKDTGAGVLRDQTVTNVFTSNTFDITAGNDFNLTAYLLGDLDGSYANVLQAAG